MTDLRGFLKARRAAAATAAPRICFVHVPKCAGTSIAWAIRRHAYRPQEHLLLQDFGYDPHAARVAAGVFARSVWTYAPELLAYHLAAGNVKYAGGHVHCPPALVDAFHEKWSFVSILRDPVDRFISAFTYDTFKKSDHSKNTLDIDAYLENENGLWNGVMYLFYFSDLMYQEKRFRIDYGPFVEAAVENLKRFRVLGTIERLDAWVADFERAFGRRLRISRDNTSPRNDVADRIRADDGLMRRIRAVCEPDVEVYRRALG